MSESAAEASSPSTDRPISKPETLKNRLLDDIRAGVYRVGDALPSVRQLAERYRVSKFTVAQALFGLSELNVIDVAHGKATRVRGNPFANHVEIVYAGLATMESQGFWSAFHRGIAAEAENHPDFTRFASSVRECPIDRLMERLDPARTSAVLVAGMAERRVFDEIRKSGVPFLALYEYPDDDDVPRVTAEITEAVREIADRFRRRHCRRVVYLHVREVDRAGDPEAHGFTRAKFETTRAALLDAGVMPDDSYIFASTRSYFDGYGLLTRFVRERGRPPDGVVLSSDAMALGVYRAAHELRLRIPEDLLVVGFDNLTEAAYLVPSLTSVEVHREEMGRYAFKQVVDLVENRTPLQTLRLPAKLVLRESFS